MTAIDAVCFDLDNTLCVSTQDDEEVHEEIFERVDFEATFTPADVQAVDPGELPDVNSARAFYEVLYDAVTDDLTADQRRELVDVSLDVFDETAVEFRAGAPEALEFAREQFDSVGLLTQGERETQHAKLEKLGIRDAFDAVVVCGGTDLPGKPNPEPFEALLDQLSVAPEHAIYVCDSLRGDVAGATAVGMQTAWLPRDESSENPDPEPTYVLDSPAELPDVL